MSRTRFSIVIPTRERADTLYHTLRTCVEQDYEDCEIIVSDNSSVDHTREVVAGFRDARVKYTNPGRRVGMGENFEHAFGRIGPDTYAICIGDDDGLTPGALARADEILASEKTAALTGTRGHYDWPGLLAGRTNQLMLPKGGTRIARRRAADFVDDYLAGRCTYGAGPLLYQGFVSSRTLEALRQRTGRLFKSRSPDVYAVFAISGALRDYTMTEHCFVIDGASPRSNGATLFGLSPDTTEARNFQAENEWPMHEGLIGSRSLVTGVADAYLYARDAMGELTADLRWERLLADAYGEALALSDGESIAAVERMAEGQDVHLPARGVALAKHRWRQIADGLKRWRDNVYLDCAKFGVHDIHGAAQLAGSPRLWQSSAAASTLQQARLAATRLLALRQRGRQ
jgi:glycosyltransferase involved in cell wall biosynthesis